VSLAETESEAVDDEREMKVTLDEEDDTIAIKVRELKSLEELLTLSLQAPDIRHPYDMYTSTICGHDEFVVIGRTFY
jgi:hypothetical protein